MDQDEMKAKLKDVITARVKDDLESAKDAFHQVLQAKMRARINPAEEPAALDTAEGETPEGEVSNEVDLTPAE